MIAWVSPPRTVRSTPRRISLAPPSAATSTCRSLISSVDMWCAPCGGGVSGAGDGELGLDGRLEPFPQLGKGDAGEDLAEEPSDDQAACDVFGDAAALQVEQLLVVEATGRAGVAGPGDLTGLDLEVRHRVGAGALGEHE